MGKAIHQIQELIEQSLYVIKNHRHMNDKEMVDQALTVVPHLQKVLLNM